MNTGLLLLASMAVQPPSGWQGLAVTMLMGAGGGSEAAPVATQTLAPGEILLELSSYGLGRSPADAATLRVSIHGSGASQTAAQADHDVKLGRIRAAARAAGATAGDIDLSSSILGRDLQVFDVEEPPPPEEPAPAPTTAAQGSATAPLPPLVRVQIEPPQTRPHTYSSLEITVRNVGRMQTLLAAIRAAGGEVSDRPQYSVTDDTAARRAARATALAKARADAEAYAASLNMRVVRLVRMTERGGFDLMSQMFTEMSGLAGSRTRSMFEPSDGQVPTMVVVGVDFILAPR